MTERYRKFQTLEEVEAYLSGRKIECLICGRKLFAIGLHLMRKHEMTADDYKNAFGIPKSHGLIGTEVAEKRSEQSKDYFNSLTEIEQNEIRERLKVARLSGTNRKTCDLPAFKTTMRNRVAQYHADAVDDINKLTSVKCFYCGEQTSVTAYAARSKNRRFRCDECSRKLGNKSSNRSYYANRDEYLAKQRTRDRERYAREKLSAVTAGIGRPRRDP